MSKTINLLIDTSPLGTGHAHRGIGTYTNLLSQELAKNKKINLQKSTQEIPADFKPDLVHYPYFDLFFSTLPLKHPAPKTVVTIHDVIPLIYPDKYPPGLKGGLKFFKQKFALSKIDAVITDSLSSKKDIINYLSIDEKKIHVIYLAANQELPAASEKEISRARRQFKLPVNYILYVGDINYNKNIPQLIKTLRFLPENIKLLCVGKNFRPQEIPEWQWIVTQIALTGVEKRVKFLTEVNSVNDLAAIYSGALCYVQPSFYEGFGLPLLEAMQCKTPVISAHNSSLIEVGGEAVLYAHEEKAEAFGEKINEVLAWSKTKRADWIKQAFAWSQKFSWAKTSAETIKVYEEILG